MFERFTPEARQAVVRAQQDARAFAHPWIGTEHLLLGVAAATDSPAAAVLAEFGITFDRVRAALEETVGRGGFCERDVAALRSVGIDLEDVRRAAEASFGPGALDRPPAWRCRRRSPVRRRRPSLDTASDELPFMPRAKRALERARDEADRCNSGKLDLSQLLLGLLDPKGNMAVHLLELLGADPELVASQVRARIDEAA